MYGEISGSPLNSIETLLSSSFSPLFCSSNEWGKVNDEQKIDFTSEMNRFIQNLQSALSSMSGGLELRHLTNDKINLDDILDTHRFSHVIAQNPSIVAHLEEILEEWCNQIETYLEKSNSIEEKNQTERDTKNKSCEFIDDGPKGELDFWRTRMQRLTTVTEQLKRRDCINVVSILSSQPKVFGDQSRPNIPILLRRWKHIDIRITEASNEAKDNVKYLYTLQRFIEPLYSGTAQSIVDTLPALLNSIKVTYIFYQDWKEIYVDKSYYVPFFNFKHLFLLSFLILFTR